MAEWINILHSFDQQSVALKRKEEMERNREIQKEAARQSKMAKKSSKLLEQEKREEGLQKSLDQNNKGFAMLQKMGYKAGMEVKINKSGVFKMTHQVLLFLRMLSVVARILFSGPSR